MGEMYIDSAKIDALSAAFVGAAFQVRELLGTLVNPAAAVGPALGSGTSTAAYSDQWGQIRDAIGGAAVCLDEYAKALSMASATYQGGDSYVGGGPR